MRIINVSRVEYTSMVLKDVAHNCYSRNEHETERIPGLKTWAIKSSN